MPDNIRASLLSGLGTKAHLTSFGLYLQHFNSSISWNTSFYKSCSNCLIAIPYKPLASFLLITV